MNYLFVNYFTANYDRIEQFPLSSAHLFHQELTSFGVPISLQKRSSSNLTPFCNEIGLNVLFNVNNRNSSHYETLQIRWRTIKKISKGLLNFGHISFRIMDRP